MSNSRPRAVDSKHKRDGAINVADFKIDDILNVSADQLLAEVAEDFGDPAFLAAQFDAIPLPAMSSHDRSGVNRDGAVAIFPVQLAAPGAAPVRAFPRLPRWSFSRAALAILSEWLGVPLRRRIFLGTFATLLLVATLTPGIYLLLVDRSADRIAAISQDEPLPQLPAPTASGALPTRYSAPVGPADQPPAASERTQALQQPSSAERKALGTVTGGSDEAAGFVPHRLSSLPTASVAPRGRASQIAAAAPAIAGAQPAPRAAEGGGFFVQLSAPKSEAEALSTLRALKSKYPVLKGHEPVIRQTDEGERGVTYMVQVGPFESPGDADRLCKQLKTAGGSCFVIRN